MECQTTLPASWEISMQVKKQMQVRTRHWTTDWFQIGKGVPQYSILHPAYLTYMQSIMQNARLEEAQAGIETAVRNINNLRYAGHTTLMAESEELKSFLPKVKEESEKAALKLIVQRTRSWHLVPSLHGK